MRDAYGGQNALVCTYHEQAVLKGARRVPEPFLGRDASLPCDAGIVRFWRVGSLFRLRDEGQNWLVLAFAFALVSRAGSTVCSASLGLVPHK